MELWMDSPSALAISWELDRDGVLSSASPSSQGVSQFARDDLSAGLHTLTTRLTDSDGLTADDIRSFRVDTPPTSPLVSISPDPAYTSDTLVGMASGSTDADGDPITFSVAAFGGCLAVWVIIFFCVFKGVSSSSYIVWATVPIPTLFVLIMIINGNTKDGSSDGIKKYFSGKADGTETTAASQWADAAGQIFFGLSVCLGIMTSYGSYNDIRKPVILDSFIISVSNCSFSFIAGFAVWAIVGYLEK